MTTLSSWAPDPGEPTSPGNDLLYVGRLEKPKGVNLLLKAWRLGKGHRGRRLRIAGTGPLEDRIRSVTQSEDDVDYLGHLDRHEVAAEMRRCGVVVVPSLSYEAACPLTVIEALAHGLRVMVNGGTSVASAVSNEFAWCVQPAVESWHKAMGTIRPDEVEARGSAARKRYVEALRAINRAQVTDPGLCQCPRGECVSNRRIVAFIEEWLPRYRIPFLNLLRERLAAQGIEFRLYHGQPTASVALRSDSAELPWAHQVINAHLGPLVWQPVWRHVRHADLVIVDQANRLVLNYLLLVARATGGPAVGFFGHGANLQGNPSSFREHWKRALLRTPDWWFAYTDGVAERVMSAGYPRDRITVVQNAVDTSELAKINVPKRSGRCIYVGSLHEYKRLPFLLESADRVAGNISRFELIVVGDGPLRSWLQSQAKTRPWLRLEGANHSEARDKLFVSSELTLMPGTVGLVVVDSFAARAPLVTTGVALHSPEIDYLQDGFNGRVVEGASVEDYADAVTQLLVNRALRENLEDGCDKSARKYTVEEMVARFLSGISEALEMRHAKNS